MSGRHARAPTIGDTARAFRTGERSPLDVLEASLARIAELDAELHAFATVTAELARAQARIAAAEVRDDREIRRPLLGIPVGVKDIIDVAGVPTRVGLDGVPGAPAADDATVWRRLADAGAMIVGKTRGLCPTDGILPLAPTLDHVGPMARTPADAALLLAAMGQGEPDRPVDLADLRVGLATVDALWTPEVRGPFAPSSRRRTRSMGTTAPSATSCAGTSPRRAWPACRPWRCPPVRPATACRSACN